MMEVLRGFECTVQEATTAPRASLRSIDTTTHTQQMHYGGR
jgi:hypothetical protein